MLWRYADLAVASDVPFAGLPAAHGRADITVRRGAVSLTPWTTVQSWPDVSGDEWLAIDKSGDAYRLRFPELRCLVSEGGSAIEFEAHAGVPDEELAHLLLHQVLPLAVSRRGRLVLHACAVETPRGAIGLVGESGAGKSTLAAAFCRRGYRLIADDALVLHITGADVEAQPTAAGLRLGDDMANALAQANDYTPGGIGYKRRITAPLAPGPVQLARLVLVGGGSDRVGVDGVPSAEGRVALLSHLFRMDVTDVDESRRMFDFVQTLAGRVAVRRLTFPDGLQFLDPAVDALLRDLEAA